MRDRLKKTLLTTFVLGLTALSGGDQSLLALKKHALSSEIRFTASITGAQSGVFDIDRDVLSAMARVPRHEYLGYPYNMFAYMNVTLPAQGQDHMIPEPFISAIMIHLLDTHKDDKVLEIGFGAGYDAAVISRLAGTVYSVEQDEDWQAGDKQPAAPQTRGNIVSRTSGSELGWPEAGPFDSILVRQSMTAPPLALLNQLKPGGRLVVPVGRPNETQRLMVYTRENGGIGERATISVRIPPLLEGREI